MMTQSELFLLVSLECIGWTGTLLLALCMLPQVVKSIRTKDLTGVSTAMLVMWGLGEVLSLIYEIGRAHV